MRSIVRICKKRTTAVRPLGLVAIVGLILTSIGVADLCAQPIEPQIDPDRPWVAEADKVLRSGELETAGRMYRELTGAHGGDFELWLRIALVDLELGRPAPALEAAQRAIELAPKELDALLMLAQCQAMAGNPQAGIDTLRRGLELHPQDRQLLETLVSISLGLERWADAAGLLRELIRQHPANANYLLDLGRILLTQGDFDEALQEFRRARELGADVAMTLALEGKVHLAAGRIEEAVKRFEESLALRPNGDAHGGLGTVQYLRGERERAIQSFRRALEYQPDDADLHYNMGNVLAQTERLQEAEEAYRRSLRLDPGSATTHLNLGILLLNRFAVAEAEQHLRWAAQIDATLAAPHLHLGRIAGALYDYAGAIAHYRRYRSRVENAAEKERIAEVLVQLETRRADAQSALARGEVHLLQLLVSSEERAQQLIGRVRRGEDFFIVAQQESELAELAGVDAGFLDPTSLSPVIRSAVEGLTKGEMTPPLKAERGWFVFKRVQ